MGGVGGRVRVAEWARHVNDCAMSAAGRRACACWISPKRNYDHCSFSFRSGWGSWPKDVVLLTVVRMVQPAVAGPLPSAEGEWVVVHGAPSGRHCKDDPPPLSPPPPPPPSHLRAASAGFAAEAIAVSLPAPTEAGWSFFFRPLCVLCAHTLDLHRPFFRCDAAPSNKSYARRGRPWNEPGREHSGATAFCFSPGPFVVYTAGGGVRVTSASGGAAWAVGSGRTIRVVLDGPRVRRVAPVFSPTRHDGHCCGAAPFICASMGTLWNGCNARGRPGR